MSFRFTTIDEPNASGNHKATEVYGIGLNTSVIVGAYGAGTGYAGFDNFLGNFATLAKPPGATNYNSMGINDFGNVVGIFTSNTGNHGYLEVAGSFWTLDDPSAVRGTAPAAINDSGTIVGSYGNASGFSQAFFASSGIFFDLIVPGAAGDSAASGINSAGDIVGHYADGAAKFHGFIDHHGSFTTLDVPGARWTSASGINDSNQIVGRYSDINNQIHGFLYSGGRYTTFDIPGAGPTSINPYGIDNNGVITGTYVDAAGSHGFAASLATPHDFYDGGTAGLLWRNSSGFATWDMNGSSIVASGSVAYQGQALNPDSSWSVAGIADFNADGIADVL
jgi:probable HAF family extracellular repeat protein